MVQSIIQSAEARMLKCIDAFKQDIAKVRTGRAHPSLLENIRVDYYGNDVPLNQVSNVTVGDARTLVITPWEKRLIPVIEKAIMTSDLGLNPVTSDVIRVPLPPLTEERRKELIKVVRNAAETARVSIRTVRRDANAELKESLKQKTITEDEERRHAETIQTYTDRYIADIDQLLAAKEKDLMVV